METPAAALRTRTITWQDPKAIAAAHHGRTGLEFLQMIVAKELPPPPIGLALDYELLEAAEGHAVFGFTPSELHYNPIGTVHGGVACTLLDSAMSCAVHSLLPAGARYTTLELKVNLVRGITAGCGPMRAIGKLIHAGRTTGTAEGRLVDGAGKLYAHGTTTCMILRD